MSRCESRCGGLQCSSVPHDSRYPHGSYYKGSNNDWRGWTDAEADIQIVGKVTFEADAPPAPRMTPDELWEKMRPGLDARGIPWRKAERGITCYGIAEAALEVLQPQPSPNTVAQQSCAPGCEHERRAKAYRQSMEEMDKAIHGSNRRIAELEEECKGMRLTYNLRDPQPHEHAALDKITRFLAHLATVEGDSLSLKAQRDLREVLHAAQAALKPGGGK